MCFPLVCFVWSELGTCAGVYPPRIRCYDLVELSMKFERYVTSEGKHAFILHLSLVLCMDICSRAVLSEVSKQNSAFRLGFDWLLLVLIGWCSGWIPIAERRLQQDCVSSC